MKIVLHIGTEKTGTTSIQSWVNDNAGKLKEEGVWQCRSLSVIDNRALSVMARGADKPDDGFNQFGIQTEAEHAEFCAARQAALAEEIAEARAAGMRLFFITSEHLQSRLINAEMVQRVADILRPFECETDVVCFLRPQIDAALSLASTRARVGIRISRREFETIKPTSPYYNYQSLIERWADAFGAESIRLVPFMRHKNVVGYFTGYFGLTHTSYAPERRVNEALDYRAIALGNLLDLPRFLGDGRLDPNRAYFVEDLPVEEKLTLSRGFAQDIQARFTEQNRALAEAWDGLELADLCPDWSRYPETGTLDELETCDTGPMLRYVVRRFNAELYLARATSDLHLGRLKRAQGDFDKSQEFLARGRDALENASLFEPLAGRADALGQEFDSALTNLEKARKHADRVPAAPARPAASGARPVAGAKDGSVGFFRRLLKSGD